MYIEGIIHSNIEVTILVKFFLWKLLREIYQNPHITVGLELIILI